MKANQAAVDRHEARYIATSMITVWECRSIDGKQVVRVLHPLHPDDQRFEHEYQRIVYRGSRAEYKG